LKVIFVGAGPGDPELLTIKAEKLLRNCQYCIYTGSLVSPEVISLISENAEKHDSAGMDLEQITEVYKQAKEKGIDVIRLHTGDPSIFGAILEQMERLDELGISYEVVPGVSSFQAAAASLKAELTVPEKSQAIVLTRVAGRTPVPDEQDITAFAKTGATLCIFLSVHSLDDIVEKLIPYYGENAPVAVVYKASWADEKTVKGTLADISGKVKKEKIQKTAIIIVGAGLERGHAASKLYGAAFSHGYRKA